MLEQVAVWLNAVANPLGRWLLAPIGVLPGWLSATLVALATGVLLLIVFRYTSPQRLIKRSRDDISAHLLALKLFKDSPWVAVRAQGRILLGAGRLLVFSLPPVLVLALPVTFVLGQLALWYQARPLQVGEEAILTVRLNATMSFASPDVCLQPTGAAETTLGPVRVLSKQMVCWNIKAREPGYHRLVFQVDGKDYDKELAVGDGFMRVSAERPGWSWPDIVLHPWEQPFRPESPVRSIKIDYPRRASWTSGTDAWLVYWFVASTIGALCFRRVLGVNI
jgi:hypothetical protein